MDEGIILAHYVYILKCSDDSYYTGYTTDIERRVKQHNDGTASRITRGKLPTVLVHKEEYGSKSAALKREAEIKSWPRKKKEGLMNLAKNYRNPMFSPSLT